LDKLAVAKQGKKTIDLHAERLHTLTQSEDEHVAVKALTVVAAYRFGKPTEHLELGGDGGGPILVKFVDVDTAA
jgi:hypothetical protein